MSKILQRGGFENSNKKKVLVLYEFFFPGFKAGGPIQSLVNLVNSLSEKLTFWVSTTAFDLTATQPYDSIKTNTWTYNKIGNNEKPIQIWYSSKKKPGFFKLYKSIKTAECDIIFINGLYTQYFIFPLIYKKFGWLNKTKIILSPRGMLQQGSLQIKSRKKQIFITLVKSLGLLNGVDYHATTNEEADDIKHYFSEAAHIKVIGNIPKVPMIHTTAIVKEIGTVKLVSISLISEVKNLLLLLEVLRDIEFSIELDIFGPIKSERYWNSCVEVIKTISNKVLVTYKGELEPEKIQSTISNYHVLVSLTKGENFGHSLYESMSCGRPIITSYFTPWNKLQEQQAGWNVDIHSVESIHLALQHIVKMNQLEYDSYCSGALQLAKDYYNNSNFLEQYQQLFS